MKSIWRRPRVRLDSTEELLVSSAGGALLAETARVSGLERALSAELGPWRAERAVHDPGKVLLDVATAIALGGDCLADLAVVRAQPQLFGPVASDPTVSRLIATLAENVDDAVAALRTARAQARARVWSSRRPVAAGPVIVDLDATLVTAHSEKEGAAATFKRTFGFHPLLAFVDHGSGGTGEPLVALLREGNAGANTAADHIPCSTRPWTSCPPLTGPACWSAPTAAAAPKTSCTTSAGSTCSTRSGSAPPPSSGKHSNGCPAKHGGPHSTPTDSPGTGHRSPNSPPGCPT